MDIKKYIQDSINTKSKILNDETILTKIQNIADIIVKAYRNDRKVLIAGNGGSAGDAQHLAGELVGKFFKDRQGLTAFALTTDSSVITAIGNDYGYDYIFERQIEANAKSGDVFIAISTSGNSKNIILALKEAKNKGLITIGLTGENKCEIDSLCDYIVHVPSNSTPTIQESHIMIEHIIGAIVEETLFSKGNQ